MNCLRPRKEEAVKCSSATSSILYEFEKFFQTSVKPTLARAFNEDGSDSLMSVINLYMTSINEAEKQIVKQHLRHGNTVKKNSDLLFRGGLCVYKLTTSLMQKQRKKVTRELKEQVLAVGWCIEFMNLSFLIAKDMTTVQEIIRSSKTNSKDSTNINKITSNLLNSRNGYYMLSSLFITIVFMIIKEFLNTHTKYIHFYELFSQTLTKTIIGTGLDLMATPGSSSCLRDKENSDSFDFSKFTQENYDAIVRWKTSDYMFYLPTVCSFYLASLSLLPTELEHFHALSLEQGYYYQAQSDFLDCFGTGAHGDTIRDGRCTWLIVKALAKCDSKQRQELQEAYGKQGGFDTVKRLFDDLKLADEYKNFEKQQRELVLQRIDESALSGEGDELSSFLKKLLRKQADKLFKQDKSSSAKRRRLLFFIYFFRK